MNAKSNKSQSKKPLAIIILAAGRSSRMKSNTSKVLHKVAGWTILKHVIEGAKPLNPERILLVTSPDGDDILSEGKKCAPDIEHVIQENADGTGGAVRACLPTLQDFVGDVLILYGDSPLMQSATFQALTDKLADYSLCLSVMRPANPAQYGRIILDETGNVTEIIEYNDATETQRGISLCNAGFMAIKSEHMKIWVSEINNNNKKSEYYLTDLVTIARHHGKSCAYIEVEERETLGVNERTELAKAEAIMQERLRIKHMQAGVSLIAPETIYFSMDTEIGNDSMIHPFVVFGLGVKIAPDAEVKSFSHLEGALMQEDTVIGPFTRLRPNTRLDSGVHIGNFVEVKNSHLHSDAKAGHLSYIGDAEIGSNTNIGAGTITCNYDGKNKHKTKIGDNVFVGSDTALIAPVTVGDNVTIAAGSVITEDVPNNSLAIARSRQINKKDWR
jgi:bifunctional UDP-N-acetylglucosamine pyrophosphorylase / glucosamine-1-phosphate N-acetyltransferase